MGRIKKYRRTRRAGRVASFANVAFRSAKRAIFSGSESASLFHLSLTESCYDVERLKGDAFTSLNSRSLLNMLWQNTSLVLVAASMLMFVEAKAQVTVSKVHLCCQSCSDGADSALEGIDGITNAKNDRKAKTITFEAANKDAAEAALKALAKDGFYGEAKFGTSTTELKWPESGAKKDTKAATVVIESVHLCCGACVTGAKDALAKAEGVSEVDVDRKAGKITVKGKDLAETKVVAALNKAGFFGSVKHEDKK